MYVQPVGKVPIANEWPIIATISPVKTEVFVDHYYETIPVNALVATRANFVK